jgi:hypothetical protein
MIKVQWLVLFVAQQTPHLPADLVPLLAKRYTFVMVADNHLSSSNVIDTSFINIA